MAFATKFRGHKAIDTANLPQGAPATKIIASLFAMLFAAGTFLVPNAIGKLLMGVVACVLVAAAMFRPTSMRMGTWALTLFAGALSAAALVLAIMDLLNADGGTSRPVGP